jgi:glycosyltransferase involved in cell wall biosynthesis
VRILHVTDHYPPVTGGIESHVATLAAQQATVGHDVGVLTSTPDRRPGPLDSTGPVRVTRARSLLDGLRTDVSDIDLVHAHLSVVAPFSAPVVASFARRGVPTLVTVHSLWDGMGPVPTLAASLAGLRRAPVEWSAVSRTAASQVARRLPGRPLVHVLPNAVEVAPRARTRAGGSTVRLVSTMRLAGRKRPLELIGMFDRVRRDSPVPVSLTIVGDGPLRPKVEHLVRRRRLGAHVRLLGMVEPARVRRTLAGSDVYLAPAILESFGLAALEARSVGLPVVGRAETGLVEFVRDGVEGLLCRDDDHMVSAVGRLLSTPGLRHRISEHNRTVPSGLTWARALDCHADVYARAMAARAGWRREAVAP